MDETNPPVMTIAEVAAYLRIPRGSAYKLAQRGRIPGQKVGRHWRFRREAVERWLEARSAESRLPGGVVSQGGEERKPAALDAARSVGMETSLCDGVSDGSRGCKSTNEGGCLTNPVIASVPRAELERFCRRWKIDQLAVFGSALRGDFNPESDIDVLVTFASDAEWSLIDHVRMQDELGALVGRKVDLVSRRAVDRSANWMRRRSILEGAEVWYAAG